MKRWRQWVRALRRDTRALWLAARDPAVPAPARWLMLAVVAYALSPIDLIPDFIPVLGYMDDLVLLPLGLWLAMRLVPDDVWARCRRRAEAEQQDLPASRRAAAVVVLIWLVALVLALLWLRRLF